MHESPHPGECSLCHLRFVSISKHTKTWKADRNKENHDERQKSETRRHTTEIQQ